MATETQRLQNDLLASIGEIYRSWADRDDDEVQLWRAKHVEYVKRGLFAGFPAPYVSLDASRPWLVYWGIHALDLLLPDESQWKLLTDDSRAPELPNDTTAATLCDRVLETLRQCQVPHEGGFGGGSQQDTAHLAHLAPTFAAVSAIACLDDSRAYRLIDRPALKSLLRRLKQPDGAFRMHDVDGEVDVRALYCAVVVGKLTGCWDEELERGVVEWIARCQSWEGGFGGVPDAEAHGGYTYCALAALVLVSPSQTRQRINVTQLLHWLAVQQVDGIGGFRGRTNKLADGCYSFWQAACFALIRDHLLSFAMARPLFDAAALQRCILLCCQNEDSGGLRDKPEKREDFYHTCYCLSGLSIAQYELSDQAFILGGPKNLMAQTDPRFNLVIGKAERMMQYFSSASTNNE